jgi:hypothetical protein
LANLASKFCCTCPKLSKGHLEDTYNSCIQFQHFCISSSASVGCKVWRICSLRSDKFSKASSTFCRQLATIF